jgi:transposase
LVNDAQHPARSPREGRSERSGDRPSRGERDSDPEVVARPTRRHFTAEYKARIVREAEACAKTGDIGALLRREGLYSSLLSGWRRELRKHGEQGLAPKRRGPAPSPKPSAREVQLEREKRKLEKKLAKAEAIIAFQKKVHELLGIPLKAQELDEDDS